MKGPAHYMLASFAAILYFASLVKFATLAFAPDTFRGADPIFGPIPTHYLMACAGLFEYVVAVLISATSNFRVRVFVTAWLATLLALYRIGLLFSQAGGGCPCLGIIAMLFPGGLVGDSISAVLLFYLLIGSYALLAHGMWKRRRGCKSVVSSVGKEFERCSEV